MPTIFILKTCPSLFRVLFCIKRDYISPFQRITRRILRSWMRAKMKMKTRKRKRSHSIQRSGRRRRNSQHKGGKKLKRFREPWTRRTRESTQLRPDEQRTEKRMTGQSGPVEVQSYLHKLYLLTKAHYTVSLCLIWRMFWAESQGIWCIFAALLTGSEKSESRSSQRGKFIDFVAAKQREVSKKAATKLK